MQRFESLSIKAGFALLALLAFAIANFWLVIADRSDREVRLATELGALGRIDEALTMSALMAAASDDSYERRYRKLLHERDGVIARLMRLAHNEEMRAMVKAMDNAQRAMIAVELRSFALNAKGERNAAYGLLNELEYRRDLSNYDAALNVVGDKVREDTANATAQAKWWLVAAGGLLLLLGAAMLLREFRMRAHLAKEAIYEAGRRAHRTVMQTVMDAHNNFLNNMVYFRVKAEMSDQFDEEDLRLIDKALDEARDKLKVIADMEEAAARGDDLRQLANGISVLQGVEEAAKRVDAAHRPATSQAETTDTDDSPSAASASGAKSRGGAGDDGAAPVGAGRNIDDETEITLTAPPPPKRTRSSGAVPREPISVLNVRGAKKKKKSNSSDAFRQF